MKRSFIIFLTIVTGLLIVSSGCESKENNTTSTSTPTSTSKTQTKVDKWKDDPVQGFLTNLKTKGVELTEDQVKAIKEKAKSFDLSGETKYEKRVKFIDFREEVVKSILTEEQRKKVPTSRR